MRKSINALWRLVATASAFTLFGIGGALIPIVAVPWIKLSAKTAEERQRKARKFTHKTFLTFIYYMKFVGILSWDVKGIEQLQQPSQLIIANHPTLLDIVFLIAFIPHCDCIVKGKLRSNPAMSGFIHMANFISNDKGPALITAAQQSFEAGSSMIIFPEGTRTQSDKSIKFQRGAANIALRTNTAWTPVQIKCEPNTLSKQHKWYHIPHKKFHMQFTVAQPISIDAYKDIPASKAARLLCREQEQYFIKGHSTNEQ